MSRPRRSAIPTTGDFGLYSSWGERGDVDCVLHDSELEVFADLAGELDADGFLRFVGGPANCGGGSRWAARHRGVFRRLVGEDVERRSGTRGRT